MQPTLTSEPPVNQLKVKERLSAPAKVYHFDVFCKFYAKNL